MNKKYLLLFVVCSSNLFGISTRAVADSSSSTAFAATKSTTTTTASTTTESTTTASTTTASTTTVPTTTTSKITTSAPTVPMYIVKNKDICLLVQMNQMITIPFYKKSGELVSKEFYLNGTTFSHLTYDGSCTEKLDVLNISWNKDWQLHFAYKNLTAEKKSPLFSLDQVKLKFNLLEEFFPGTNETGSYEVVSAKPMFKCPIGSYFQCIARQTISLVDPTWSPDKQSKMAVTLRISDLKAEAFRSGDKETFIGRIDECSADYIPNKVVPILVGVSLALMIVIALLTFIIGSRRRQAGYQEI